MKMMDIMISNESIHSKRGRLASTIEKTLNITIPEERKNLAGGSSSPNIDFVSESRQSNLERAYNYMLRTPQPIEGIRETNNSTGKNISISYGVGASPTGLSQFVDDRNLQVSLNQVSHQTLNEKDLWAPSSPSSIIEDTPRSPWLLHQQ